MAAAHLTRTAPAPSTRPVAVAPAAGPLVGPVSALVGLALAFLVVFVWRIGGVILVVDQGHGVHSGDLLALPLALPALGQVLRWLSAPADGRR